MLLNKYLNLSILNQILIKYQSLLWESNPGSSVYKTDALPLSQGGTY